MAWKFKNEPIIKTLVPLFTSPSATDYVPNGASDIGKLVEFTSNTAKCAGSTTATDLAPKGIVVACPEDTTHASTTPFYMQPIVSGDVLIVDIGATTDSTEGDNVVCVTTNLGCYVRPIMSTDGTIAEAAKFAAFLDPSTVGTVQLTSSGMLFKLVDFSTISNQAVVVFNIGSTLASF